MAQEFYITLPSNVKLSFDFSYNMISSFNTKPQRKLYFNPNKVWHFGLSKISYTKSWYNESFSHLLPKRSFVLLLISKKDFSSKFVDFAQ